MNVEEFIKQEIETLENFKEYWKKKSENHPNEYPLEMNDVEWIEQLLAFQNRGEYE